MKTSALALLLAAGCQGLPTYLSPVGPSYCVEGEGLTFQQVLALDEARDRAVAYWDAAGLRLDSRCGDTAYLYVAPQTAPVVGATVTGGTHVPDTWLDPVVVDQAVAGDSRSWETVAHEMGHAMGLGHSTDQASVMWPVMHALPATPVATDVASAERLMRENGY